MNSTSKFFPLTFLVFFTFVGIPQAQWLPTNGPCSGFFGPFGVIGSNIFVSSGSGQIFVSNNGADWRVPTRLGLQACQIHDFAVIGEALFIGTICGLRGSSPLMRINIP